MHIQRIHFIFRLISDILEVFEMTLLLVFTGSIIMICIVMLLIQGEIVEFFEFCSFFHFDVAFIIQEFVYFLQSRDTVDAGVLGISIVCGCLVFVVLLFTCELGQQVANRIEEINNEFDQLGWYLYPTEAQRMLPTIMINVQKPVDISCYGIFTCSREQFRKVIY